MDFSKKKSTLGYFISASLFVIGDLLGCTIGGPIAERSILNDRAESHDF